MPDGSSSDAPVISPGPRLLRKSLKRNGSRCSAFSADFFSSALVCFFGFVLAFLVTRPSHPQRTATCRGEDGSGSGTSQAAWPEHPVRGRDPGRPSRADGKGLV